MEAESIQVQYHVPVKNDVEMNPQFPVPSPGNKIMTFERPNRATQSHSLHAGMPSLDAISIWITPAQVGLIRIGQNYDPLCANLFSVSPLRH